MSTEQRLNTTPDGSRQRPSMPRRAWVAFITIVIVNYLLLESVEQPTLTPASYVSAIV